MQKVLWSQLIILESFGFEFFVGDIIIRVGLGFFG